MDASRQRVEGRRHHRAVPAPRRVELDERPTNRRVVVQTRLSDCRHPLENLCSGVQAHARNYQQQDQTDPHRRHGPGLQNWAPRAWDPRESHGWKIPGQKSDPCVMWRTRLGSPNRLFSSNIGYERRYPFMYCVISYNEALVFFIITASSVGEYVDSKKAVPHVVPSSNLRGGSSFCARSYLCVPVRSKNGHKKIIHLGNSNWGPFLKKLFRADVFAN